MKGVARMSQEQYLKAPCAHCHGRVSFPASARGMTITCPHCGQQTVLDASADAPESAAPPPEAAPRPVANPAAQAKVPAGKPLTEAQKAAAAAARAINPVARPAAKSGPKPADKKSIVVKAQWQDDEADSASAKPLRCDFCGTKIPTGADKCPDCGTVVPAKSAPPAPMSRFRRIGLVLTFVLALVAAGRWGMYFWEKRPKLGKDGKPKPEGVELLNHSLQPQPGTSLLYVRGNVTNHSDVAWFEVKVECELLDKAGASLGKFSDTKTVLDAHKLFPFSIAVLDPDAKSYTNIKVTAVR